MKALDAEVRRAWQEADDARDQAEVHIRQCEEERDRQLRAEREKIRQEVEKQHAPALEQLRTELNTLRNKKAELSQALTLSSSNKDVVNTAIAAALTSVMTRLTTHFDGMMEHDAAWSENVKELVHKELDNTFVRALSAEDEADAKEQHQVFEGMLAFWRDAEKEQREHISKIDQQLFAEMQSFAHENMERLQREELALQQMFMETQEAWDRHHRDNLNAELEAAIQRRTAEFDAQREEVQKAHLTRMKEMEEWHKHKIEERKKLHEERLEMVREAFAHKQQLVDERNKAAVLLQEDAAAAQQKLSDVVSSVSRVLERLEEYKTALDRSPAKAS